MSDGDTEMTRLVGELVNAVEELQSELEPTGGPLRPPTPRELARFTSEVTIPAIILVLETNVRALRLVQRALRIAEGRDTDRGGSVARERATALGRATVDKLDDALTDLQDALDGRPPDDEAREVLGRVRDLQADVEAELAADSTPDMDGASTDTESEDAAGEERVDVDVDAELEALKDDLDDDSAPEGNADTD
jgi:hypothetical protein